MIRTRTWSPRFRFHFPFVSSLILSSAGSLSAYVPGVAPVIRNVFAGVAFTAAFALLMVSFLGLRDQRGPLSDRERAVIIPLYALAAGMLTARVLLLLG